MKFITSFRPIDDDMCLRNISLNTSNNNINNNKIFDDYVIVIEL